MKTLADETLWKADCKKAKWALEISEILITLTERKHKP